MFAEKVPLKSEDPTAKRALDNLSGALAGDGESEYLTKAPPSKEPPALKEKVMKELKQNWWMWGAIVFAVLLIGSLIVFRNHLYSSAGHGMPFLAIKENAAEACATECQAKLEGPPAGAGELVEAKAKEAYEECYTTCVAQETKEVAEEREKFKESEEQLEKEVAEEEHLQEKVGDVQPASRRSLRRLLQLAA